MLRKRSRSIQKDQYNGHLMSDSASEPEKLGQKQKNGSFFNIPGLFVGFNIKGVSDCDSVRSPTSPLDYKVGTNLGSTRSGSNGSHKSWDCSKVGLGIVDSLDNVNKSSEDVIGLSGGRNILFGSQMRMNAPSSQSRLYRSIDSSLAPNSVPKNYAIFPQTRNISARPHPSGLDYAGMTGEVHSDPEPFGKIRSYLSDSNSSRSMSRLTGLAYGNSSSSSGNFCSETKTKPDFLLIGEASNINNSFGVQPSSLALSIGSSNGVVEHLSASEIELSEDYTRIISHGPNPRTTHIFGDCVLECHASELANSTKKVEQGIESCQAVMYSNNSLAYPSDNFLSVCYFCKKKLEEGKDIYMYRGEKAFCSTACRDEEMLVEEEMEKLVDDSPSNSPKSTCSDDIFLIGMV